MTRELGIHEDTCFAGFVDNPFAYMSRASVLVLSSLHEGFGNVIAEALACGCPVVSTDCPTGPSEILQGGRYGRLVAVGDHLALAAQIVEALDETAPKDLLRQRASHFSAEKSVENYENMIRQITGLPGPVNAAER